jgi:isoleucyl-tRNA synthetase
MDLKATLNLPDPSFTIPMKADLAIREPEILAKWKAASIYHRLQDERRDAPPFVLHDGPPYTNSAIHLGTAMNKILKDFVLKSRVMMGYRVPYVPGYDNHGLPIEQAVMKSSLSALGSLACGKSLIARWTFALRRPLSGCSGSSCRWAKSIGV